MTPPQIAVLTVIGIVICLKEKQYYLAFNVLLTGLALVLSNLVCYSRAVPKL